MDLLTKSIMAVVILVLVVFLGFYFAKQINLGQPQMTREQAVSFVLNDFNNNMPDSIINITNVTPSQYPGSWHIVASVITNATTPCPSYFIYSFDYPKFGFVYRVDNIYTDRCTIYGFSENKTNIITSYPVAITRSYNLNLTSVRNLVNKYGYDSIKVNATFYNAITLSGQNYTKVWIVAYGSRLDPINYTYVVLSQAGGNLLLSFNRTSGLI